MVDTFDYNDPKTFEKSLLEHMDKYEQAVKEKDGGQSCYHLGAMQSMEHRLMYGFNYTADQIKKVKEGRRDDKDQH